MSKSLCREFCEKVFRNNSLWHAQESFGITWNLGTYSGKNSFAFCHPSQHGPRDFLQWNCEYTTNLHESEAQCEYTARRTNTTRRRLLLISRKDEFHYTHARTKSCKNNLNKINVRTTVELNKIHYMRVLTL